MPAIAKDLGRWFWRLAPANPILVRVVYAGGKRLRHLYIRTAYLTILAAVVVIGVLAMQSGESSLADLAKNATQVFQIVSIVQLAMVCIIAPVFTAAAITQEKDSQTFNILLSTPLSNGQIVLGSLLSRLYFVVMLLIAGIPLFCIMMVYGGVTGAEIAMSFAIAACTAMFTGALAITISVIKIGTGRTIFTFYLAIALYLILLYVLSSFAGLIPPEAQPAPGRAERLSWLAPFHPFLALWVVLGKTPAPALGAVAHYGFPFKYLLAYPDYGYLAVTLLTTTIMLVSSLYFVRRGIREGENTFFTRLAAFLRISRNRGEQTRAPRHVWHNPVGWREAVTGAAAGGGFIARYASLGVGLIIGLLLLIYYWQGALNEVQTRDWLFGIVVIELFIALFIATATAATSMTREKESNTLELILATPLTSRHIISGKIWGLVTAAGPLLLVPYLTVAIFVLFDLLPGRKLGTTGRVVNPEALISLPIVFIAFTAFACMVGLQSSIKNKRTIAAVATSMGLVILVFSLTGSCAFAIRSGDNVPLAAAIWPLTPATAPFVIVNPAKALTSLNTPPSLSELTNARWVATISSFISAGIYGFVGWIMLRTMVKNFDMIIRKQSA